MLETTSKINGMDFSLLIDPGETESFISHTALSRSTVMESKQEYFDVVEMASNISQEVRLLVKECEVDLGVCVTKVSCIILL